MVMMSLFQPGLHSMAGAASLFPVQPPAASTIAGGIDLLYYFLTGITVFFTVLIFSIIFYFMIRYRRRSPDDVPPETHAPLALELAWTLIPSAICVVIFFWASYLFVRNARPPAASTEIFVIGKQWMWHIQHPEGPREINELHVPVNQPVQLTMTSQDVLHDFYIPAFRVKKDVVPGRYTQLWFEATQVGTYHLYCAQYCGTNHALMIGWVYVMSPNDYAAWLAGGEQNASMAQDGARLFSVLGCNSCHADAGQNAQGPSLAGLWGQTQKFADGSSHVVDETLVRQAILTPDSVELPNYKHNMPTYKGQLSEEQMLQLIAYVKTLGTEERKSGQ
jgi:cytochrome c oxidase subunit 2